MDSFRRAAGTAITGAFVPVVRLPSIVFVLALLLVPAGLRAQQSGPANSLLTASPDMSQAAVVAPSQNPDGFLFAPPVVRIGMRAGFNFARAASGVFDLATDELTLERGDFGGFAIGGDAAFRVADPVELVFSATFLTSTSRSDSREYENQDGSPITQRTTFSQVPLTAQVRVYLASRGRQIGRFAWVPSKFAPYVGAGGGAIRYDFEQSGSFVDFEDLSIFEATLESSGWAPVALVNAGADLTLTPRVTLNADVRYQFASAEMTGSYLGITDDIDLNGLQLSVGVHLRY
jgi:opacity protein-like surface antigen